MRNPCIPLLALATVLFFSGCATMSNIGNNLNFFSVENDKEFGAQLAAELAADPENYPVLNENQYPEAYAYINKMRDKILNSGSVQYKDEFDWPVKIIHDDSVLNAFAAPGGYIYLYTGLIKFLDTEDQLAGVLAHEIAHADQRHSTNQLTKQYGVSVLLELLLGSNQGLLTEIAAGLVFLKFSRTHESEADKYSVTYLCPTDYNAAGAAGFFQKLEGAPTPPQFLSTHPNPSNRVESINVDKVIMKCEGTQVYEKQYDRFKKSLP